LAAELRKTIVGVLQAAILRAALTPGGAS
jgi:hypothetical protein